MRLRSVIEFFLGTLLSRILGLIREMGIAHFMGASQFSDVFYVAFRIPNYFRDLLADNAIQTAFIPVFVKTLKEKRGAIALFNKVFVILFFTTTVISILGILFAGFFVLVTAFGFKENPEKFRLTVESTQIMFPFLVFVSLSALFGGFLNSHGKFFIPALSSAFFNLGTILFFLPMYFLNLAKTKEGVILLSWAVLFGGFLQVFVQLPQALRILGKMEKEKIDVRKHLKEIFRLLVPVSLSTSLSRFTLLINTLVASFLREGAVSYLNYAFRIMHLPIGLFGVGVSSVSLVELSKKDTKREMGHELWEAFFTSLFFTLPLAVFFIIKAEAIVEIIYKRGAFSELDVYNTALCLIFYSLNIVPFSLVRVLLNPYFSKNIISIPIFSLILGTLVNVFFTITLPKFLDFPGLALAISLGSIVQLLYLTYKTSREFRMEKEHILWVSRFLVSVVLSTFFLYLTLPNKILELVLFGTIYLIFYFVVSYYMGIPHVKRIMISLRGIPERE